jgi:hypothetical protein
MKKAFLIFAVVLMAGGLLAAQEGMLTPDELSMAYAPAVPPEALSLPEGSVGSPEWYGTTGRFWVTGSAAGSCTPVSSATQFSQSWGYYYGTSGSATYWDCSLQAPSGTLIAGIEIEVEDSDATDDVCIDLWRFSYFSTTSTTIASGCTSGTGQDYIYITGLNETITNHYYYYMFRIKAESGQFSNRFRTVFYSAYRQISPAPGTATFPDVGTGYWAFQAIEALAAAGITTGYPDGTFKPTAVVTRAQMATFLARALGLHWKDQ